MSFLLLLRGDVSGPDDVSRTPCHIGRWRVEGGDMDGLRADKLVGQRDTAA